MRCQDQRAAHMMAILKSSNVPNWDKLSVAELCKLHARLQRMMRSGIGAAAEPLFRRELRPYVPAPDRSAYRTRQGYRLACRLAAKGRYQ